MKRIYIVIAEGQVFWPSDCNFLKNSCNFEKGEVLMMHPHSNEREQEEEVVSRWGTH